MVVSRRDFLSESTAFTLGACARMKGARAICWSPLRTSQGARTRHIPYSAGRQDTLNPVTGLSRPRPECAGVPSGAIGVELNVGRVKCHPLPLLEPGKKPWVRESGRALGGKQNGSRDERNIGNNPEHGSSLFRIRESTARRNGTQISPQGPHGDTGLSGTRQGRWQAWANRLGDTGAFSNGTRTRHRESAQEIINQTQVVFGRTICVPASQQANR
jgi:hypothetical protein